MRFLAAGACFCAALLASQAWAEEGRVDQYERLDIDKGAFEIELQTIHVPASDGEEQAWKIAPTFEYGLSDKLSVGMEIEFEKEGGESFIFQELGLQAKWIGIDPEEAPLGLGIQTSLFLDRHGKLGSQTYMITETWAGATDLTANLIYSTEAGDWGEDSLSYVLRADSAVGSRFLLGAEAGGELSGEARGRHWIGPVFTVLPKDAADENDKDDAGSSAMPALEFAVFAPLSRNTADVQFRLELDWEF